MNGIMSLETLAQAFGEKGFVRQAVLLQSKSGKEYCKALGHPSWQTHLQAALGEQLYNGLLKELEQFESPDQKLLSQIFGESKPRIRFSEFQPRQYGASPLEIHLENAFDLPMLRRTADMSAQISEMVVKAQDIVYTEAQAIAGADDEMVYTMYKDADHIPERDLTSAESNRLAQDYRHKLSTRIDRLQRLYEMSAPRIILFNELNLLREDMPHIKSILGNIGDILFTEVEKRDIDKYDLLLEKYGDQADVLIQDAVTPVIEEGKRVLKDKSAFSAFFGQWVENETKNKKKRVMEKGRAELSLALDSSDFLENEYGNQHNPFYALPNFLEDQLEIPLAQDEDTLHMLLKSPLAVRNGFLANLYNVEINFCFNAFIGLQQIVEGGPITNPDASPISVVQNHARFPNLSYSTETKTKLENIVAQLRPLLDALPDISDLATSTKLRKKKDHRYVLEELPKNPLDVTFGNDSGCCIFVPEDIAKMHNGVFVPSYLTNQYVRLFGIYRSDAHHAITEKGREKKTEQENTEQEKAQRMGLVLTFESKDSYGQKILACNSLELSRMGISGGNETVKKIVEHAENWLIGYAQQHGYAGVTMGRHSYNTSRNFSARRKDIVEEQLRFWQPGVAFYSDIFTLTKGEFTLKTRPKSCYWLWKK